jgi:hypothetical protein
LVAIDRLLDTDSGDSGDSKDPEDREDHVELGARWLASTRADADSTLAQGRWSVARALWGPAGLVALRDAIVAGTAQPPEP